jgi:hypothetical protein
MIRRAENVTIHLFRREENSMAFLYLRFEGRRLLGGKRRKREKNLKWICNK